ncbi:helicase-related protein [Sphingopyxis alaskensis]|jgi:ATP-dependent RNA helicase SUPV3L1/SUV3|uniref:Helicase-like protein n=1 Tax=Sphingopyxis alaskensis (strain DSM 13593 / LMG 18877 / RB2256) TaxID=317655 RepID=Q1GPH8_SPHAL|nr:helicase-related protein [Sphingopyxis alaskensis]ABF54444.1 helicase-like protein [Sphingopyxis alaskensis RB2256]MCM3417845.1 helicase [Sphingopyxis alaskensis]
MTPSFSQPVKAVLGPTNTGKTHLAVERLTAHASGMIGFPLRLLAREVYDRVVAIKGAADVALITGEERIMPAQARYLLGTMEALPVERDVAFVGIDEAQLGADPERGHVFTDRLLRARGREETMILGSASIRGLVRDLVPDAEIVTRPRFSTLSYAGSSKLSRLPKRSAIVAFSAEEVYAIAEMLRRFSGGAAVVMGALSPRTRNAQVAMFEAGEVDYLVATDAIGMGLNLDVRHVAFASLQKFDGRRLRRLTIAEMAQIAGRAGRHQQDGSFGTVGLPQGGFTPEEIAAIEGHHFPPVPNLFWREPNPRFGSLDQLLADLARPPVQAGLRAAPEAVDFAVLKHLASDMDVRARGSDFDAVQRLWDVCGLPDFEQLGAEHHSRTVFKLWQWRTSGDGMIDPDWFARRLARLDDVEGDIDQLASRIAAVRTLCFIAQRGDWIAGGAGWAERTQALESRLSDALHAALAQRFVDRRLALLLRDAGQRGNSLPVAVGADGTVAVDGEPIGTLSGFQFKVDPVAKASDHRMLLAAAEKHLRGELARRAMALAEGDDSALSLVAEPGSPPRLAWHGHVIATLARGPTLVQPAIQLDPSLRRLEPAQVQAMADRLQRFVASQLARHAAPLAAMGEAAGDLFTPPRVRALLAALTDNSGTIGRAAVEEQLTALTADERPLLRKLGLTIGSLDIFHPQLLKPEAVRWRAALIAAQQGSPIPPLPPHGAVLQKSGSHAGLAIAGFRRCASGWLRIDMAEKLARQAHAARMQAAAPPTAPIAGGDDHHHDDAAEEGHGALPSGFVIDPALATSLGLDEETRRALLGSFGFRSVGEPALQRWRWSGLRKAADKRHRRKTRGKTADAPPQAKVNGDARRTPTKQAKAKRAKPGNPRGDTPRPPRRDRPDRRGPSPNSPFAGLAALLADARKD